MAMPVKVLFHIQNPGGLLRTEEATLYPHGSIGFSGISVKEYDRVTVEILSNDNSAVLQLETSEREDPLEIYSGESIVIMEGRDAEDMLVPGDYPFFVKAGGSQYEAIYRVLPNSLGMDSLLNLRDYLEKTARGLSFSLLRRRLGVFMEGPELLPTVLQMFHRIQEKYTEIKNNLDALIKNPHMSIEKQYQEYPVQRRPDAKTTRWLVKRGAAASLFTGYGMSYEKHAVLSSDNPENRWLLRILKYLQYILRQIEYSLNESLEKLVERRGNKLSDLENLQKNYNLMIKKDNMKKDVEETAGRIKAFKKELKKYDTEIGTINDYKLRVLRMMSTFARVQHDTWLAEIHVSNKVEKPTLRMMKDPRYASLYRFYKEIQKLHRREVSVKEKAVTYKKTSLLFEYYVFIIVSKILEELGFEWVSGWLADRPDNPLLLDELTSDTLLRFESNEGYIEVAYDTHLPRIIQDYDRSQFIANIARQPDIRIAYYSHEGVLLGCQIIEVKCSKFWTLWSDFGETDQMRQIRDYLNIQHYDVNTGRAMHVVKNVIVVYPKQNKVGSPLYKHAKQLVFVQLEPTDYGEEPYGYDVLKECLREWLEGISP
jgi:hypothetical protein